jgi:hypothetical protein
MKNTLVIAILLANSANAVKLCPVNTDVSISTDKFAANYMGSNDRPGSYNDMSFPMIVCA